MFAYPATWFRALYIKTHLIEIHALFETVKGALGGESNATASRPMLLARERKRLPAGPGSPLPDANGTVCQECVELRLGVAGMCRDVTGLRLGKRCKRLIYKPIYSRCAAENPRVGGSIPPLATSPS